MKCSPWAGLAAAAVLGAQAQQAPVPSDPQPADTVVFTARRGEQRMRDALREVVVISRQDIERAGDISLAELLQRHALIEVRAAGGPGQPAGIFLRGAGPSQILFLIDGLRAGSATVGGTAIENLPLGMIERVEVVKGPMSSLYGPDAAGGVVNVFTRASPRPRFFAAGGFGSDARWSGATGFTAIERETTVSFAAGGTQVDAPSATNARAACHDPDRDDHENAFANAQVVMRQWQGETLTLSGFVTQGRTRFDGCPDTQGRVADERNRHTLSGASLSSFMFFAPWWSSRLALGEGRDELAVEGSQSARFDTRQQQASWLNEFGTKFGTITAGVEVLRQEVASTTAFTQTRRDTNSAFVAINETWRGQRLEASLRRDDDDAFGARNTGTVSYGTTWPGVGRLAATYGRGFRAPTFFDLYAPPTADYAPNPDLRPEQSKSTELSIRSNPDGRLAWRIAGFDNRFEDLITWVRPTMQNVLRARIRGLEASAEGLAWGTLLKGSLALQRPRDEETGRQLPGRAERFGRVEATRAFGAWSLGAGITASGPRFDAPDEAPNAKLPGYAIADASVRYLADRRWRVELTAANLFDRRHENAVGYDAPRRSLMLTVRFEGR